MSQSLKRTRNKKLILYIVTFMFLFLVPLSYAQYPMNGGQDGTFLTGQGIIDNDNAQLSVSSNGVSLSDGKELPLVEDLDGDGTKEIIVLDGSTLRLFQGSDLTVVDAFDLGNDERTSNMVVFDIDNDLKKEVIVYLEETEILQVIEYNGSSMFNQTTVLTAPLLNHADGETLLQCGAINECVLVYIDNIDFPPELRASVFNGSSFGSETDIYTSGTTSENFCFPKVRTMPYGNLDGIGGNEYFFNTMRFVASGDDQMHFYELEVNNNNVTVANSRTFDNIGIGHGDFNPHTSGTPNCQTANLPRFFSSMITYDFDGASSNGEEIVIGVMTSPTEYIMGLFESDFDTDDDFPELFEADGQLVSNPFRANIWGGSGDQDFCVLGHDPINEEVEALCGTKLGGGSSDNMQFKFDTTGTFNVSDGYRILSMVGHSGQHRTIEDEFVSSGDTNPSEFITPYGVMTPNPDIYDIVGLEFFLTMEQRFELPFDDLGCMAADPEDSGSNDLICISASDTLYYINDGIENKAGEIDFISYNPCPTDGAILKVNTTFEVLVTVTDQNSPILGQDNVNANITIYPNSPNELEISQAGFSSGDPIPFNVVLNDTGTFQLLIEGWDDGVPSQVDTETQTVTVALNGLEFGDTTCDIDVITTAEEVAEEEEPTEVAFDGTSLTDNSVKQGVDEIGGLFNIGGGVTFILILTIVMASIFWFAAQQGHVLGGLGASLMVGFMLVVFGTLIGLVSIAVLTTILVVAAAIIALVVRLFITGQGT